jgi:hypothetical protein
MELVVRNVSDRPVYLGTGDSASTFDFVVTHEDGTEVWNRLHGQIIPLILIERVLKPGQTIRFRDIWDQRSNRGRRVRPGTYSVHGALSTNEAHDLGTRHKLLVITGP